MTFPRINWPDIEAVVFDVDGTLYNQPLLRRKMALDLVRGCLFSPRGWLELRIIREFRRTRARLAGQEVNGLARAQYVICAELLGVDPETVEKTIEKWMYQAPLRHLMRSRFKGVREFFELLRQNKIKIGVFSDYPAREKLAALDLHPDAALSAVDPMVDRLKPDPKGLLMIADQLGVPTSKCIYIGDRDDLDGVAAQKAGMRPLILSGASPEQSFNNYGQLIESLKTARK